MKNLNKLILVILCALLATLAVSVSSFACYAEEQAQGEVIYAPGETIAVNEENSYSYLEISAGVNFNELEKSVYNQLKQQIVSVANGSQTSTVFEINADLSWTKEELGVSSIVSGGSMTDAAKNAASNKFSEMLNSGYILISLLSDCPYEMFWFDKTTGFQISYAFNATSNEISIASIKASFSISSNYKSGTDYVVNAGKIDSANDVVATAKAIVEKYKDKSDYEKLLAYKDEICTLVDYNHDALSGVAYGDPWQLIYVFDNDASTKVVCEGYAKAFKYLCDLSDFDKDIYCYLTTGLMYATTSENHMWNVVSIDGANYLVDVTNIDAGHSLFLVGATLYSNTATYKVQAKTVSSGYITYTYASNQANLFCEGYLSLSSTGYHEHIYSATWKSDGTYHWKECSCGDKTELGGHIPDDSATCSQLAICKICNKFCGGLLSHNYNRQVISNQYLKSAATCTQKAVYYYVCSCEAKGTDSHTFEYGEPLDHVYDNKVTTVTYLKSAATCGSKAIYYYSCDCGAKGTDDNTFEYGTDGSHVYDQQVTTQEYLKSAATCTAKAVYCYSCTCGAKGDKTFKIGDTLPHSYDELGVCETCGTKEGEEPPVTDDPTEDEAPDTDSSDDTYTEDDSDYIDGDEEPKSLIEWIIQLIIEFILMLLGIEE